MFAFNLLFQGFGIDIRQMFMNRIMQGCAQDLGGQLPMACSIQFGSWKVLSTIWSSKWKQLTCKSANFFLLLLLQYI